MNFHITSIDIDRMVNTVNHHLSSSTMLVLARKQNSKWCLEMIDTQGNTDACPFFVGSIREVYIYLSGMNKMSYVL